MRERRIDVRIGERAQQHIENAELVRGEAQASVDHRAGCRQQARAIEPLVIDHAEGIVAQSDGALAPSQRRQQLRKPGRGATELDGGIDIEPVDPRSHRIVSGPAVHVSHRTRPPAVAHQRRPPAARFHAQHRHCCPYRRRA
jgi:hypothetical protein